MKKVQISILFILMILFFTIFGVYGCFITRRIPDFCFTNEKTDLDQYLNIKGVYYSGYDSTVLGASGIYKFLDNGLFYYYNSIPVANSDSESVNKIINTYFPEIGFYLRSGDTIKLNFIPVINNPSHIFYERWLLIIDKNKFININSKIISNSGTNNYRNRVTDVRNTEQNIRIFHHYPYEPIDIDKWKKHYAVNKRWFWCSDSYFNTWKRQNRR